MKDDIITQGVHSHFDGPYQTGEDRMVFNITKKQIMIRKCALQDRLWSTGVEQPWRRQPRMPAFYSFAASITFNKEHGMK